MGNSVDIECVDMACRKQRGGGFAPNDIKGMKLRFNNGSVKVDYVR
jgi:hypothetical protein